MDDSRHGDDSGQALSRTQVSPIVVLGRLCARRSRPKSNRTPTRLQPNGYPDARSPKHLDKTVDTEQLDPAAHEVTHARLGDAKEPSRLNLR